MSVSGESPAESKTASSAAESDKTVISSKEPMATQPVPAGLHPRELGRVLVGQRLDDLWLEEFIGGGGMGAVFRALDTRLQRNVAVKVLSTYQAGDEETTRRFQVEAQSAARLDHANIARVHYVGEDRGVPYIVFEYIEGNNLRDLVNNTGPLPLADAIDYTLQIADALNHAWQRNVVHRDIKPSNILITPERSAKLVDMGLARFQQIEQQEFDLTASGMTIGTFDYISPEQARNPKDADTRSDIYSLGCTLYFMLTGRPPFSGGTALQKLLQHQGEAPPGLMRQRGDMTEEVSLLVDTMLAKRIEDRFQDPRELVAALLSVAENFGISHSSISIPATLRFPQTSQSTFLKHAPWAVPVILLIVGVFGYELVARNSPQNTGPSEPVLSTHTNENFVPEVRTRNQQAVRREKPETDSWVPAISSGVSPDVENESVNSPNRLTDAESSSQEKQASDEEGTDQSPPYPALPSATSPVESQLNPTPGVD